MNRLFYVKTVLEMEMYKCRYTFQKRNKDMPSENGKREMDIAYIDRCQYEVQEQK
jgi:hypothetical protein